jgi:hypothetical protein
MKTGNYPAEEALGVYDSAINFGVEIKAPEV